MTRKKNGQQWRVGNHISSYLVFLNHSFGNSRLQIMLEVLNIKARIQFAVQYKAFGNVSSLLFPYLAILQGVICNN